MLNIITTIPKVISGKRGIVHILGRFRTFRHCYSLYNKQLESLSKLERNTYYKESTLFPDITVDFALKSLEKEAVFLGLKLPQELIVEIQEFSKKTLLAQEDGQGHFYYSDVKNGYLPDGRPIATGIAVNPSLCNAIEKIINDPVLREIVEKYLGYNPKKIRSLLRWSFVLELPDTIRMKLGQANLYHYDIGEFNSVYINFYLSKTDKYSGAHAMIQSSHNNKTLNMLFHSAIQSEEFLIKNYGEENRIIIEGEEGFGFIQDPYCYHRAIPPIKEERLLLQLQFS